MSKMREALLELLERKDMHEREFIAKVQNSGCDPDNNAQDVVEGDAAPCEVFFPLAEQILDLDNDDLERLFWAAHEDGHARRRAYLLSGHYDSDASEAEPA